MLHDRFDFDILYYNGNVYVFGGFDSNNQVLKKCEKYNLLTNKWKKIA